MPSHAALIPAASDAAPVYLVTAADWDSDLYLPDGLWAQAKAQKFKGQAGQMVIAARPDGAISGVLFGLGDGADALAVAALAAKLPAADYAVELGADLPLAHIAVGWSDGAYRFDRYLSEPADPPRLVVGEDAEGEAAIREAIAIDRLRDLVNTPAEDMGPPEI